MSGATEQRAAQIEQQRVRAELRARLFGGSAEPVRVDRFEIRRRLGAGAMGVVYAVFDPKLQREVALKVLNGVSPRESDPFLHEAQSLARLSHPNVLQVYEAGVHEGAPFLVSELVSGGTLRAWLSGPKPRPTAEVLRLLIDAGKGLLAAHQRGLIHRDVKPENVLVDADGRPRVADFGLARPLGPAVAASPAPSPSTAGQIAGTLRYMAPEQMRGERVDPLSDQFSFCVMAFEALFGRLPYAGDDPVATLSSIEAGQLAPVPPGHPAQHALPALRRGLSPSPTARFPSMVELLASLERVQKRGSRLVWLGGVALALVSGVASAAWVIDRGPKVLEFQSKEERAIYEQAARLVAQERFLDCEKLVRGYPKSVPLMTMRISCARGVGDPKLLDAACTDWSSNNAGQAPLPECNASVVKAKKLLAEGRLDECMATLERDPYTTAGIVVFSGCATRMHSIEGYFRMCNYQRRGNPQSPPCKRLTALGPRPGPP